MRTRELIAKINRELRPLRPLTKGEIEELKESRRTLKSTFIIKRLFRKVYADATDTTNS